MPPEGGGVNSGLREAQGIAGESERWHFHPGTPVQNNPLFD